MAQFCDLDFRNIVKYFDICLIKRLFTLSEPLVMEAIINVGPTFTSRRDTGFISCQNSTRDYTYRKHTLSANLLLSVYSIVDAAFVVCISLSTSIYSSDINNSSKMQSELKRLYLTVYIVNVNGLSVMDYVYICLHLRVVCTCKT